MEPAEIAMIAIPAVLVLIGVIWFFSIWNRLVSLEENADQAWSNIDVLLNQRYDMIPNLVNIVKGTPSMSVKSSTNSPKLATRQPVHSPKAM